MSAVPASQFVNVVLSIAEGAVQQQGFGIIMILGQATVLGASQILTATSAADWVTAGGAPTDEEYLALSAIFSQEPAPSSAKVARRSADTSGVQRVSFAADFQAAGTVNVTYTYTDLAGATQTETIATAYNTSHAQTITDVTAALLALNAVTACTGTNTAPGARFDLTIDPALTRTGTVTFTVTTVTGGAGAQSGTTSTTTAAVTLADRLASLATADVGWYCLLLTHVGTDNQRNMDTYRAAVWTEANTIDAIHIAQNDQAALAAGTSGNIAKVLEAAGYHRTHVFRHTEAEYADAALAGRALSTSLDVRSIDWHLLRLAGITATDYTPTERSTMDSDKIGYYTTVAGVGRYLGGIMASGRYTDQQLTVDWFGARVAEEIMAYFARGADSNIKRTYSDATVSDMVGLLTKVWLKGVRAAHFAATKENGVGDTVDGLTIVKETVADQSSADRTARLFAGLSGTAKLAGSIRSADPITLVLEV